MPPGQAPRIKLYRVDHQGASVTALFGFPGTYLISQEVSKTAGENEEERKLVTDHIMPKMVIGSIVSVSVVSGLAASVMIGWM